MNRSTEKGYYCIDRDYREETMPYCMTYLKAGGDNGLTFSDAIAHVKQNRHMVVVDADGEIVFDPMRIN